MHINRETQTPFDTLEIYNSVEKQAAISTAHDGIASTNGSALRPPKRAARPSRQQFRHPFPKPMAFRRQANLEWAHGNLKSFQLVQ